MLYQPAVTRAVGQAALALPPPHRRPWPPQLGLQVRSQQMLKQVPWSCFPRVSELPDCGFFMCDGSFYVSTGSQVPRHLVKHDSECVWEGVSG